MSDSCLFLRRQAFQIIPVCSMLELVHKALLPEGIVWVVEAPLPGWRFGNGIVRYVFLPLADSECWLRCCKPGLAPFSDASCNSGIASAPADGSLDGREPGLVPMTNVRLEEAKGFSNGLPREIV